MEGRVNEAERATRIKRRRRGEGKEKAPKHSQARIQKYGLAGRVSNGGAEGADGSWVLGGGCRRKITGFNTSVPPPLNTGLNSAVMLQTILLVLERT